MKILEQAWYQGATWPYLMAPLEWLYRALSRYERRRQLRHREPLPVPVIVVGNITVGGTGKSPLVALLCRYLKASGWSPGIISRGYGGEHARQQTGVLAVTPESDPDLAGDEPVMLADQTRCPLVIARHRTLAAQALLEPDFMQRYFSGQTCDLIISDDGLQHLSLDRDIEWVVVDHLRQLGNGHCLPVGPLREPPARLAQVDCVLSNGATQSDVCQMVPTVPMQLKPVHWRQLTTGACYPIAEPPFDQSELTAIAGIGHPERFFRLLEQLGCHPERRAFGDHHRFRAEDLPTDRAICMTAKDAVKCRRWVSDNSWVLDVEAVVDPQLLTDLHHQLLKIAKRKSNG